MGLDVKGVNTIIHYGACNDSDDSLQESGRAGSNPEEQCHAIIIKYKQCLASKHITKDMKDFITTGQCRRQVLLKPFANEESTVDLLHNCCDNCALTCKCKCLCNSSENCSCENTCTNNNALVFERMNFFSGKLARCPGF